MLRIDKGTHDMGRLGLSECSLPTSDLLRRNFRESEKGETARTVLKSRTMSSWWISTLRVNSERERKKRDLAMMEPLSTA